MRNAENRVFSSGGVIIKKSSDKNIAVLLIKDRYGRWTWPKGHIEKGETVEETAKREIFEEVGLKAINLICNMDKIEYVYKVKGEPVFKTVYLHIFEAYSDEKLQPLKSEVEEAKWFAPDEALKTIEYEGAREILKKAIDIFRLRLK